MFDSLKEKPQNLSRSQILQRYDLTDGPDLPNLKEFTALAAQICQVPMSTLSFLDEHRLWFRTAYGLDLSGPLPEPILCAAVADNCRTRVISNALESEYADVPPVAGELGIRFYAGVPLLTPENLVIGTLSVMDTEPRSLTDDQTRSLETLGRQVMAVLNGRRQQLQLREQLHQRDQALAEKLLVVDAVPASVAILDRDGVIIETNAYWRKFARQNGYPDGRWGLGDNYLNACSTGDRNRPCGVTPGAYDADRVAEGLAGVLSGEKSGFAYEYPCHTPDQQRWFRMLVEPLPQDDARARPSGGGAVVMHVDITERKLAEKDNDLMRFAVDNVTDGIVWVREDGSTRYVNRAMSRITGFDQQTLTRMTVFDRMPALTPELWDKQWQEIRRWGVSASESSSHKHDGTPQVLELSSRYLDFEGEQLHCTTVRDVTQRRAAEDEVRVQLQQQKTLQLMNKACWQNWPENDYLQYVLELLVDFLKLDLGMALRVKAAKGHCRARTGLDPRGKTPLVLDLQGLNSLSSALQDNTLVCVDDCRNTGKLSLLPAALQSQSRSGALLPIGGDQATWGLLWLGSRYHHVFNATEQRFLQQVAHLIADQIHLKQSRHLLHHSQHLMQQANRLAGLASWSIDLPQRELHWSEEMGQMLGYPSGVIPSLSEVLDLCADASRESLDKALDACITKGTPFELELELTTFTGQRLRVQCQGYPILAGDGSIERLEGALRPRALLTD